MIWCWWKSINSAAQLFRREYYHTHTASQLSKAELFIFSGVVSGAALRILFSRYLPYTQLLAYISLELSVDIHTLSHGLYHQHRRASLTFSLLALPFITASFWAVFPKEISPHSLSRFHCSFRSPPQRTAAFGSLQSRCRFDIRLLWASYGGRD